MCMCMCMCICSVYVYVCVYVNVCVYGQALDIRVRLRGLHLDTAESLYNLASVYAHSGDKKSARLLFLRAGELTASLRGADDADALDALAKADKCS